MPEVWRLRIGPSEAAGLVSRPHCCENGDVTAGPDHEDKNSLATSFGTGGLPFYAAESGALWSAWKSFVVILVGLGGIVLGIIGEGLMLVGFSVLIVLIGTAWLASKWRADRAARRLERRAHRRHESIS